MIFRATYYQSNITRNQPMLKTKESESYPVFNNKIGNHEKLSPLLKLNDIAKIFYLIQTIPKTGRKRTTNTQCKII